MKLKLLNLVVGKNISRITRVLLTGLGALLLSLPLFDPSGIALDASLGETAEEIGGVPAEKIEAGETTVGDFFTIVGGMLLLWSSRIISRFRAQNPQVAGWLGWIIGRSIPSLIRAGLTATGVFLARWLGTDAAPEAVADLPLSQVLALALPILIGNIFSAIEDGKKNPKPTIS